MDAALWVLAFVFGVIATGCVISHVTRKPTDAGKDEHAPCHAP